LKPIDRERLVSGNINEIDHSLESSLTAPLKPLRLTHAQRRAIAELLPNLVDRLKLGEKNQRVIPFTTGELQAIQTAVQEALTHPDSGMKRNSLGHVNDAVAKAIEDSNGIMAIPATQRLYQFKITLSRSKPPIWRRIQVRDCTLDKLHEHIQTAMGWTNSHLHDFRIGEQRYGDPWLMAENMNEFGYRASTRTKISQVVPKTGERFQFRYEYDFGDGWDHEILFEGCPKRELGKKYPVCLEGERACPPEDVGGIGGFYEFVKILANPKHEQHEHMKEWVGEFDAEKFDAGKATKAMRKGLGDWQE